MSATAVATPAAGLVGSPRMSGVKLVFSWIGISLLAFPLGGLLGWAIGGHVDGLGPALIGGAITGAAVGFAQWLFLRRDLGVGAMWIAATGVALAAGLVVGAPVVGYETDLGSLVVMGAIGWAVTTTAGIDVDNQFDVFGAFGSIAFGILSGLLLMAGSRAQDV